MKGWRAKDGQSVADESIPLFVAKVTFLTALTVPILVGAVGWPWWAALPLFLVFWTAVQWFVAPPSLYSLSGGVLVERKGLHVTDIALRSITRIDVFPQFRANPLLRIHAGDAVISLGISWKTEAFRRQLGKELSAQHDLELRLRSEALAALGLVE